MTVVLNEDLRGSVVGSVVVDDDDVDDESLLWL